MVDNITAFPAGITVAATWNKALMLERGQAIGEEARGKGVHVMLGPCLGPLGAYQSAGRNWEGFGSDPYLQGINGRLYVRGMQGAGVTACAKHFLANEQERFRRAEEGRGQGFPKQEEAMSSNLGMKELREVYGWPFEEVIEEGLGCIMCAYNQVNGSYACENEGLLDNVLKGGMGFQGFVVSDWLATRSTVRSARAGLDMNMPGDAYYFNDGEHFWGPSLTTAVVNGSVSESEIDDKVLRILATYYQMGQDSTSFPNISFSSWFNEASGPVYGGLKTPTARQNLFRDVRDNHNITALQVAEQGHVLLKNSEDTLPLARNRAGTPWLGLFGTGGTVNPKGPNACGDRICNEGTLGQGWGSGTVEYETFSDPSDVLLARAREYNITFSHSVTDDDEEAITSATKRIEDAGGKCLVFVSADSGEGYGSVDGNNGDRKNLTLWNNGEFLIDRVASGCSNTIVVLHAVGPVLMEPWINNENIKAVLHAHLPGQAAGDSLANILFGEVSPSGRLPYTIFKDKFVGDGKLPWPQEELNARVPQDTLPTAVDYQTPGLTEDDILFPFGFGLSYSTFTLSSIRITHLAPHSSRLSPNPAPATIPDISRASNTPLPTFPPNYNQGIKNKNFIYPYIDKDAIPATRVLQSTSLPTPRPTALPHPNQLSATNSVITVTLTNTGNKIAFAVPQLYLRFPSSPEIRKLRGFEKVMLEPGASVGIEFPVKWKEFAIFDEQTEEWVVEGGDWKAEVAFDALGRGAVEVEWTW